MTPRMARCVCVCVCVCVVSVCVVSVCVCVCEGVKQVGSSVKLQHESYKSFQSGRSLLLCFCDSGVTVHL